MNKKFLSAILFGTLMVTSTGTFVSCKDYDDDIDRIDSELSDLRSQIAALQNEVTNGNWVTSLTNVEGGFTVTFKNGSTYTIVSGKDGEKGETGEAGKDGDGTIVEVKDGYWYLNDEKTEYLAVTEEDLNEVKVPYVNGANMWVFFDEDGNEVVSKYNANGAAYAVNTNGVWTLNIPDANGELQAIALPTAASMISEIEFLKDNQFQTVEDDNTIALYYWNATATTKWKGPRGNIANNTRTYSSTSKLYNRIAPASVDASELDFKLIDSKDNVSGITLAASRYTGLLTKAAENGLYITTVVPGSYVGSENAFKAGFESGNPVKCKALALKPATANYKSLYNVKVGLTKDAPITMDGICFDFAEYTTLGNPITKGVGPTYNKIVTYPTRVGDNCQVKVGQTVYVYVQKEEFLYDMYLTANDEDVALFGLVFGEDGRTFTATKSPDNVTDATIDLIVHTLSNDGKEMNETIITVEINRTLGEATYDKQTKQPTKLDDTFLVSADKLKSSLGSDLNAWYASVKANTAVDVLDGIYDDENCDNASDVAPGQLKVVMSEKAATAVTEENIAAKLNYLEFQLNINKATKPLKIGKAYYARLSFVDKTSDKELNYVVVPFELTKPDLSAILVKESGVFLNGGDLAHAYMYWGDAKWSGAWTTGSTSNAPSRYFIDRAFTDMHKKLADAKMTTYVFAANDNAGNVKDAAGTDTGEKTSFFATIKNKIASTVTGEEPRSYVELKDVTIGGVTAKHGYKKDLNVSFTGHYLDVNEDSWKYSKSYQFRVMSPILEGEAIAANNMVEVSATGRTKLYKEDVWAKTYNNDVKYDIFAKGGTTAAPVWYRDDIKHVTFSTGNKNVFEVTVKTPTVPVAATATTAAVDSYIEVEGVTENTAKLNVAVDDIWGYTLNSSVDIKTTLNTGK